MKKGGLMTETNKNGLSRFIPSDVKREIRRRSKFGCVICRKGLYTYEHIDPVFSDATEHNPNNICCLCAGCHDSVTRGQYSKAYVRSKYLEIQNSEDAKRPITPLDFHNGRAEILIGGLLYSPLVNTVIRYHGEDLVVVEPGCDAEPGKISAFFSDPCENFILAINENELIGSLDAWDIEIVGQKIVIRRKKGEVILKLRLDPPGGIVIERLDMRYKDAHILITEYAYAVGRYVSENEIAWCSANLRVLGGSPKGVAIEFYNPSELLHDHRFKNQGIVVSYDGFYIVPLGIAIAKSCNGVAYYSMMSCQKKLDDMRSLIFSNTPGFSAFHT
jgi:hypothetical protein